MLLNVVAKPSHRLFVRYRPTSLGNFGFALSPKNILALFSVRLPMSDLSSPEMSILFASRIIPWEAYTEAPDATVRLPLAADRDIQSVPLFPVAAWTTP